MRCLYHTLVVLSLCFCVVSMMMWVSSHWQHRHFKLSGDWFFDSQDGVICVGKAKQYVVPPMKMPSLQQLQTWSRVSPMPWPVPTTFTVMEHGIRMYYVSIVFWLGVLPFSWLLTKAMNWEAYRQSHNLCRNCGYDLRATPNRCPECGTVSTGDRS